MTAKVTQRHTVVDSSDGSQCNLFNQNSGQRTEAVRPRHAAKGVPAAAAALVRHQQERTETVATAAGAGRWM